MALNYIVQMQEFLPSVSWKTSPTLTHQFLLAQTFIKSAVIGPNWKNVIISKKHIIL